MFSRRGVLWLIVGGIYFGLLLGISKSNSPNWDEVAHLPAGISHWHFGQFELFSVNPPLVRTVAAVLPMCAGVEVDWKSYSDFPPDRAEFWVGKDFAEANGSRTFYLVNLARIGCFPFAFLGAAVCFVWASQLYGRAAGILCIVLWILSPNILASAATITPDVGAASLGALAWFCYWRWLNNPTWHLALLSGFTLGLAELCKSTWIVLFALYPIAWLAFRYHVRQSLSRQSLQFQRNGFQDHSANTIQQTKPSLSHLVIILVIAVFVLNLFYGFDGTGTKLGHYQFASRSLTGVSSTDPKEILIGNRFTGGVIGWVPLPFPKPYVTGIDLQKWSFEMGLPSYLYGQWSENGWWYYYLAALLVKVPIGIWLLFLTAVYLSIRRKRLFTKQTADVFLWLPIITVFVLVSSQTGINHHLRYLLPIFPFLFIWISKVAMAFDLRNSKWCAWLLFCVFLLCMGSFRAYPHQNASFNQLAGGPRNGHHYLLHGNLDWGQNLFAMKNWLERNPKKEPVYFAYFLPLVDPLYAGIDCQAPPNKQELMQSAEQQDSNVRLQPGWYAISASLLHTFDGEYSYLESLEPDDHAGYSILIFHLDQADVQQIESDLGLKHPN